MANHVTSWGFAMSKIQGCQNVWWRSRFSSWCPGVHNLVSEVRRYPVSKIWGCRWGFWCPWNRQWLGRLRGCQPVPGPPTIPYYTIHTILCHSTTNHIIPYQTILGWTTTVNTLEPQYLRSEIDVHSWYWRDLASRISPLVGQMIQGKDLTWLCTKNGRNLIYFKKKTSLKLCVFPNRLIFLISTW